jgi:transposase-like protein
VYDGMKKAVYVGLLNPTPTAHAGQEYTTMHQPITNTLTFPSVGPRDVLTEILRDGAQSLLSKAIAMEVDQWINDRQHLIDQAGHRQVVRNGFLPERAIITGVGSVHVKQPRVRDRRCRNGVPGEAAEKFTSKILPPYLRKAQAIEELIPWLYLKGISSNDFPEALQSLLGLEAGGLSPSTITRLTESWQDEQRQWSTRSLADKHYVYVWADGVHFNIRLEEDRQCILVLMGATAEGVKELIALADGHRESEESWKALLLEVKSRGLIIDPHLAIGDGALGFWKALPQVFPTTRTQRCWVHKMANVLDKMPKRVQPQAKTMLHHIWMADTKAAATIAFDLFIDTFQTKHAAAVNCLAKDRQTLLTFYDFPAEHWMHIRTTNPIESVFATVRLRHDKTKGNGSRVACLTMVFKLMESASKHWRALNGSALMPDIIAGVQFADGIKITPDKIAA